MSFPELSVIIGLILGFSGTFAYLRDTLAGRTKPNRVTYLIWGTAAMIGVVAAFANGVRWAVLPVLMASLGPLLIFLASFHNKNAYWKTRGFDYVCGAFSILALVLWRLTHEPNIAILFAVASNTLAAVPTWRKSWTHPETETASAYVLSWLSFSTAFLATPEITFSACAFPAALMLSNMIILFALKRKKISSFLRSRHSAGRAD